MAETHLIFFSTIVTALSYSYFISSTLPTGIYRFISLLPIFYLFTILPLLLSSAFATAVAAFFLTWLTNFKLILFAFNHGPLYPQKTLIQFIAIASLPAKIKSDSSKSNNKSPLIAFIQSLIFPLLISIVYKHKRNLNTQIVLIIYCFLIFLLVDLLVFVSNAVIWTVVGVELDPPSDEPYLATSLQDFWGRRWNLMVTNILRHTVYKPVKLILTGKEWDWVVAVVLTFVVSGLMHELLFYYVTRVSPTWEMTSFFVLHGVCVVVEVSVKRALAGKLKFPVVVSRLLTVGFVVVTSFWLFFPPLIESGADVKVVEEFKVFVDYVKTIYNIGLHEQF
ncbi:hypothetical protein L1987_73981 [Smallanthus sonchifolius]|uniref:Uncharacterized protein n=1 Tax=Smallanthus sonchifolius TaxID=185202 RepID=A0ACB9A230_9ASTR|nr:hypothetical protein L1987_73981 [Smallanthus sonchifolius]